jgi:hypothetical protein
MEDCYLIECVGKIKNGIKETKSPNKQQGVLGLSIKKFIRKI